MLETTDQDGRYQEEDAESQGTPSQPLIDILISTGMFLILGIFFLFICQGFLSFGFFDIFAKLSHAFPQIINILK